MKIIQIITLLIFPIIVFSQKNKVQGAWRALSDFEYTLAESPDISYLMKAKENIDLATNNEEAKNQVKTYSYRFRIYVHLFAENLKAEDKKLISTIADKNERLQSAYGNVSILEFEEASKSLDKLQELDLKMIQKLSKSDANNTEEDGKLFLAVMQMQAYQANLATGRYNSKKYDEAADFFHSLAASNTNATGKTDTSNFYNACISAQKSANSTKIINYNKKMIDLKIASPYNYQTIYDAFLSQNDTLNASQYLKIGRAEFSNDVYLMNRETEVYLKNGQQEKALSNLQIAIAKDPTNAQLFLVLGNVYDNLANPKGKNGKDTAKPAEYDNLVAKAAQHYQKAIDLKPSNEESYFNALYNLGALYNNYGGTLYNKSMEKTTMASVAKKQKDSDFSSMEYYKKAIPFLEQALVIKPADRAALTALRKLYLLTGNEAKGKELSEKLK